MGVHSLRRPACQSCRAAGTLESQYSVPRGWLADACIRLCNQINGRAEVASNARITAAALANRATPRAFNSEPSERDINRTRHKQEQLHPVLLIQRWPTSQAITEVAWTG